MRNRYMAQKYQVEDVRGGVRLIEAATELEAAHIARDKGDEVLRVTLFSSLLGTLFSRSNGNHRDGRHPERAVLREG